LRRPKRICSSWPLGVRSKNANSVGIGDQDFSGNDDEYTAALYNFTDAPVTVERGARIVQGIIKPIVKCEWEEVEDLGRPSRGGFGTTGAL